MRLHPFAGRVPHNPKLTALGDQVLGIDNYLVFYKVKSKVVLVYRILHLIIRIDGQTERQDSRKP